MDLEKKSDKYDPSDPRKEHSSYDCFMMCYDNFYFLYFFI